MIPISVYPYGSTRAIKFVEDKKPDMALVGTLLEECAAANQWANFGPLYTRMADEYAAHMSLGPGLSLTPCANAGIGLEMIARTLAAEEGKPKLRWVGSAFSFKNLGRGYFSDMRFVDCDGRGVLDFLALLALPLDEYDGIVVTNPFGLLRDFERFVSFARQTGKKLIIDNAAGMDTAVPAWPWQVFSLHHTKPYGVGEGGLVLSPTGAREYLTLLINYDVLPDAPEYWLNNGKISDIACAFHIARLRDAGTSRSAYLEQRERLAGLFRQSGAETLLPVEDAPPSNSLPVLMGGQLDEARLAERAGAVDITRQYPPLRPLPRARRVYSQIINFPTHPGLQSLSDDEVLAEIGSLMACRA